jgi:hypothetical protein
MNKISIINDTNNIENANKKIKLDDTFNNMTSSISTFFTYTIIDNYNKAVNSTQYTILNLEQMCKRLNEINGEDYHNNIILLQQLLPNIVCKSLSECYVNKTIKSATNLSENIDYDICFLINTNTNTNELTNNNIFQEMIKGFLVVQRNLCAKYPNVYCLKLVCALEQGHLLVGCYLYSILSHPNLPSDFNRIKKHDILYPENNENIQYFGTPIEKIGLLELSASYKNINALCLYSKFGFTEDKKLRGYYSNCFIEENNLPMIINFEENSINLEKIIKIVKREEEIYKKHIICQITDKKLQKILIKLYLLRDKRHLELLVTSDINSDAIKDLERRITNINRDIKLLEDNPQQKIEGNSYLEELYNDLYGLEKGGTNIQKSCAKTNKKRSYTNKTRRYTNKSRRYTNKIIKCKNSK